MSEPLAETMTWEETNEAYLQAAMHWLRLRLAALAEPGTVAEEELAGAREAMVGREEAEPLPALIFLARQFGLSRFERELLLLCCGMELDTRVAGLCAAAQDHPGRPYPTFALALALFDEPAWEVMSPDRPLRYWRLLEINQPGAQPLTASALRADERIVNYVKGLNYLDDRLAAFLTPFPAAVIAATLPPSQAAVAEQVARYLESAGSNLALQLVGSDRLSQQLVAWQAALSLGVYLYQLPVALLPAQAGELENLARLWQRESLLLPLLLYLDAHETGAAAEGAETPSGATALRRFLARLRTPVLVAAREVRPGLGPTVALEVAKPTPPEQQEAWQAALKRRRGAGARDAGRLAGQFDLNLVTIGEIAGQEDGPSQVWESCLRRTRPRLDTLAQRIDARAAWEEIVLPEREIALLREIAGQVAQRSQVYDGWGFRQKMNRGFGISVLFAGESGTGKTMAAEVLANELQLNLYRIDLSAVVSKYIGETEKNLRRLFDAAEDGGAILFFDEADALFGKRSEVKDSHDRYANIEINYLLQRMEGYRGLAVLATNLKSALDRAFLRRLRFVVNFPFPGHAERLAIWEKVFPPQTPSEGLNYGYLARLNLTGGSIHNVAINAAFRAAGAAEPVTMAHVLEAARTEFYKLEQPVDEAVLRWSANGGQAR
jgi:hypothetical protein